MKKITALVLCVILVFTTAFTALSAVSVPSDYDPFGTSAFGPDAPVISASYKQITQLRSFTMGKSVFEINVTVNNRSVPLYISFPSFGGFRFYGRETGDFKPSSLSEINYSYAPDGSIVMSGADDTTLIFTAGASFFNLKIYDGCGNHIVDFSSSQLKFGYNGSALVSVFLQMPLEADEMIYGTGERFSGLNQTGRRTIMWNMDCGYHGNSENAELWRGYKNIPILHSSRGYTIFYNSYCSAEVDIGYSDPDYYYIKLDGSETDFYLWTGAALESIEKYTDLTGKSILPPKWAFRYLAGGGNGYWYGSDWGDNNEPGEYLALLQEVIDNFEAIGTPDIAAIYCEGNMAENYAVYELLNSYGIKLLKWNSPDLEREKMQEFLPGISGDDLPIVKQIATGADSGSFIDFTHGNSAQLMLNWLKYYAEKGMCGGLLDFGELIQPDTVFSDNSTGKTIHNKFSLLYAKGYNDAMESLKGNDYLFMSRAACAGSQSYTCCFSGDQAATFYGLRQQLSAGLSLSASGFSVWGGDLAGYEGTPTTEVFCRGTQLSAFYPLMRAHGTRSRMPWDYGQEGIQNYQIYYWLRENLLDTIYSSAVDSSITGLPMMRAYALQFPEQKEIAEVEDSYIFCEDFLVAPVLESGAVSREITFPDGKWYSLWDGGCISGNTTCTVAAPLTQIPVYVRSGATVPMRLSNDYQLASPISEGDGINTLLVTPAESTHSKIFYSDAGTQINYTNRLIDGGYRITATAGNLTAVVKAFDTAALAVVTDGQTLCRLSEMPAANEKGYYVTDDGMTIISVGTPDWKQIDIITGDETLYCKEWNFTSENELTDFDTYINDMRVTGGYAELRASEECFTWNEDGCIKASSVFYDDESNQLFWAGISQASVSLSPKNINIRNFETEIVFKINSGGGSNGAVMIGLRETIPGAHKPQGLDSWSFGLQDGKSKIYSALVSAVGENKIWIHNAGNTTSDASVDGAEFISDTGYYRMKLRIVENFGTVTVYSPNQEELYTSEFVVYENLAYSGAVTYYVNGQCVIDSVTLTNLDENGKPVPFDGCEDYIAEKTEQSVSDWNVPCGFKITEEENMNIYRYGENAYDDFTLSAVIAGSSPVYIGISESGTEMPGTASDGVICCIENGGLTVRKYIGSDETNGFYALASDSVQSISLNLKDGELSLFADGSTYVLGDECGIGSPFIKAGESTIRGVGFLFSNIFGTESGYSVSIAAAAQTKSELNSYWKIGADGSFTRCNTDANGESPGQEWYNNSNHIADMAFVYFRERGTADSLLTFKVKAGSTRWGRIYAGIGGHPGKSWRNTGGGVVFYIDGSGNLLASGFLNSETAYAEGDLLGVIDNYDINKEYTISIRRQNGFLTVFVNGESLAVLQDREWLQEGCIYFASNSEGAAVSDIRLSYTVPFGDTDYDFVVEQTDFETLCASLLSDTATDIMDINRDGKADICDAVLAYNEVKGISAALSPLTVSLSLNAESAVKDNLQSLSVGIAADAPAGGLFSEIVFDTAVLEFDGSAIAVDINSSESFMTVKDGSIKMCMVDINSGALSDISFNVITKDYLVTQIAFTPLSVCSGDGTYIECVPVTLTVEINRHLVGDVNDDMVIDVRDMIRFKKYFAGSDISVNLSKANCDFEGGINASDLTLLSQLLIGAVDKL